ncbi:MAG: flagellar protein FlaG [Candidatus Abyssobacteria bacterium SURF_17]|uniref:Flagellar protein FlaG n=1 Tax=Candidatus Abyssobacteria bacterium SURF_17 TaxID=2093361 RepID=A0A419F2F6_9BACT|nr:MAG: flagellar protein FlaG [Candidatus Abyssubacteria bacterium SURF_17]
MGIRIDQAGYPGLDPAAGTTPGVNTARRVASSPPAASQFASVQPQTPARTDAAEMDAAEIESTLDGINKYLDKTGSSFNFIHDEASGRSAVQVLDKHGEVIRQIPPQELLDAYAKIRNIVGILLDESG